ncbi:MAG: hypothetical protein WC812_02985 [Candidatus Pacearchaeota archaeon]|jgi:hypothetical protein
MKKRGKGGQFYLVAAMIVIAVIIGISSISNYSNKSKADKEMKNFEQELNTEVEKNLEYISLNSLSDSSTKNLWINLTDNYITKLGKNKESIFIFGTKSQITVKGYKLNNSNDLQINVGSGVESLASSEGEFERDFNPSVENVTIIKENIEYVFDLKQGQNFYYLISKEYNSERIIIRN